MVFAAEENPRLAFFPMETEKLLSSSYSIWVSLGETIFQKKVLWKKFNEER